MSPGPLMERVYIAIKQHICEGAFRQGEPIDLARLSRALSSSVSPVRDALHRLEGERLIESQASGGFRIPVMSEPALRDAYRWNADLLLMALGVADPAHIVREADEFQFYDDDLAATTASLFEHIGRASINLEHRRAIQGLNDRLHVFRKAEPPFVPDYSAELHDIAGATQAGAVTKMRRMIGHYHRQRLKVVPDLVAALRPDGGR